MKLEEAFQLMNNLDMREAVRKFGPQWSTVVVDTAGEIIDVIRFKEEPTIALLKEQMSRYPKSVQFTARPGVYDTLDKLAKKIQDCVWTHQHDKDLRGRRGLTQINGINIYVAGPRTSGDTTPNSENSSLD